MQTFHIITVGTLKEAYLTAAVNEYVKRLGAYVKVELHAVKESRLPEKPNEAEVKAALAEEAKRMLALVPPRSYRIALCVEGRQLSSTAFSELLSDAASRGGSHVAFFIGSSEGLDENLKKSCDLRLSVSEMTFPHQLMRVMLLEQLYRAENIANGGKYHK